MKKYIDNIKRAIGYYFMILGMQILGMEIHFTELENDKKLKKILEKNEKFIF